MSEVRNQVSSSLLSPKLETVIEESCPCSGLRYFKDTSVNHPSDLLNKILSGNDLFSFKEHNSSPLCCDSHEHEQEDVLLEFVPKQSQMIQKPQLSNSNPFLPFLLNTFKQNTIFPTVSAKPRAVEIFFYPKKRGMLPSDIEKLKPVKKDDVIQIVGDKEIRNDFKTMKFVPPRPSSVKKDLTLQEKNKSVTKKKVEVTATDKHLNTVR
ncbi:jg13253 [Pararge aegeria aegeria]|uniref:Jg13253 protein n=2 Tax=Pararge aegeria TaxID=116150 RepID=A0A8S4RD97_9NEOP|nr:jg13253 [Pararge aegeria aegeria]